MSFVSAGFFSDVFGKITGNVVVESSVSDVLDEIIESQDVIIIMGDNSAPSDNIAAVTVSQIFSFEADIGMASSFGSTNNWKNKNVILIGGPCANEISEEIIDEVGYNCYDWKFKSGESLVKVFDNGDGKIILVAGTTKGDTLGLAGAINIYDKSKELAASSEVVIITGDVEDVCGNGICGFLEYDLTCAEDCGEKGYKEIMFEVKSVMPIDADGEIVVLEVSSGESNLPEGVMSTTGGWEYDEIYIYNFTSGESKKIGDGRAPMIDGDYIVYMDEGEWVGERRYPVIKLYKISTEETLVLRKILNSEDVNLFIYDIAEDKIIWTETFSTSWNKSSRKLVEYNILTEEKRDHLNKFRTYMDDVFVLSGDKVFYQGPSSCVPEDCLPYHKKIIREDGGTSTAVMNPEEGDSDIWSYDLVTEEIEKITINEENQDYVKAFGDTLIWIDGRLKSEGKGDVVYSYNLETGDEKSLELYDVGKRVDSGIFYNNKITWIYRINPKLGVTYSDIYVYDLKTGIESRVTTDGVNKNGPVLGDGYILWSDLDATSNVARTYIKALD